MVAEEFAHKLWITESSGRLYDWGDHGLAMGPYQTHPDWLWDWAEKLGLRPLLMESWAKFEGRVVRGFFNYHAALYPPVEIAMKFHLGHYVREGEAGWDAAYAERFNQAPVA